MKSKESGIPIDQVRQMEIQKNESLLAENGLRSGSNYYATLSKTVYFINNSNCRGSLRISCNAYCNFDRIISVESNGFAAISDGGSRFEVVGQNLSAVKVSDYNATVYGPVSVRTTSMITEEEAMSLGIEVVGFSKSYGSGYNYYYYKNIDVNCSMQP